jgi:uracil-DNA glycosylase family 4
MSFDERKCEGCPIAGQYEPVYPTGAENARFLVITDVPSAASAEAGRLMTKYQSRIFGEAMTASGFSAEDFRFVPACYCPMDPDGHVNKVKTAALKHCRQHIENDFKSGDYSAIVPLGAKAATQAFGRATKITKVRGVVTDSEDFGVPIFPLMSPAQVAMYPQNAPVFEADVRSFSRAVGAGYDMQEATREVIGNYEIVDDLEFLIEQSPEILAFDTETTGTRWYEGGVDVRSYRPDIHKGRSFFKPKFQILTMQFTTAEGNGYMLVWDHPESPIPEERKPRLRNQLRRLLCNPGTLVVGQAAKFDNVALWATEGIRYRIGGDTLMLATLFDENVPEKNLDVLTKIHVPAMAGYADYFNSVVDKGRMWEQPLSTLLPYGCGDSDAAYRLYHALEADVAQDERLWSHYCNVTIPGLNAFAAMETRGMHIDEGDALFSFKEMMKEHVAKLEEDLLAEIPRKCKQGIVHEYLTRTTSKGYLANKGKTAQDALSFTRNEFIKQILFTHPDGFCLTPKVFTKTTGRLKDETLREPSISSKDHLPYFFEECPFTVMLAEYMKDRALLNTNVVKFEENYIRGGKVRPNYHLHKAVTGRSSSDDPNGQNYPKRGARAKVYRRMFVAPEGYYVIEIDLSQAELRIAACMSGDRTMIDIYLSNGDIHKATALIVANITQEQFDRLSKAEQKELRQKAKAVNFGFLYGMGWRKFIGYAKTQYGVEFTEEEAKRIRHGFFRKYKALSSWHDNMRAFAAANKFVRSFSGRVRHLPMIDSPEEFVQQEAGRQAINSPVQEFGSSLGVMALGRLNDEIDPKHLQVVGFIHDAIVAYVKKEYLDWGMRTLKRYMQTNPLEEWFGTRLRVPIVADVSFGLNLGEVHECEGFSLDAPYDYTQLKDKDGNLLIEVPRQRVPPSGGRLTRSAYTTSDDLEDEDVVVAPRRYRMIRAKESEIVAKRIERSRKQMVINRRVRAQPQTPPECPRMSSVIRRSRPS